MARFFAVNWTVALLWLIVAIGTTSTTAYWYGRVYGWRGAESVATAELLASGIEAEHYSTTDYGDQVRVLFSRKEPGHYIDATVERDRNGKWAVTELNKDFSP